MELLLLEDELELLEDELDEDELELLEDEELELLDDDELELLEVEELELLVDDELEEEPVSTMPDEELLLELITAPLLDELEDGPGPCWFVPEELLLELEELLEDELLEDDGFVLPVELELELEELELAEPGSFGFLDPPLPQAAKDVVKKANKNDLANID